MSDRAGPDRDLVSDGLRLWFAAVDPVRLDSFRRLFALTFLAYVGTWFLEAREWLTPWGFHFTAESVPQGYAAPFPPMPAAWLAPFGLVLFSSTLALVLGWKPRLFTWVVLLLALYVDRVDMLAAYTLNKLYVVGFLILAVAPAVRTYPAGDGERTVELQSAWPIRILQITLLIHYGGAGICKVLHGDWLSSSDVMWTQVQGVYRTDAAAWMLRTLPKSAFALLMYGALAFELIAPFLFSFKRTRPLAMIWGFLFQMSVAVLMHRLIFFSIQMLSFYVLFVDERRLLAIRERLRPRARG